MSEVVVPFMKVLAEHRFISRSPSGLRPYQCTCRAWAPVMDSYAPAAVAEFDRHLAEHLAAALERESA